ncbi:Protein VACUOLELESS GAMETOPHYTES [Cardamine amara subsp. amara]|uniref:Protein VACUOLELESS GAMETOPHYTES n=1 Tax=Cardamine amara subsp. amara TaxID=228776 RepID=A0ABD1BY51_CARAN
MDKKEGTRAPPPPPPPRLTSHPRLTLPLRKNQSERMKKRVTLLESFRPYQDHDYKNPRCHLSHPTHPHTLSECGDISKFGSCFSCGERILPSKKNIGDLYYCTTCDVEFHHGCHRFPRKLTHPYHLQHPLTFTYRNYETGIMSEDNVDEYFCTTVLSNSNHDKSRSIESDIVFDKCAWCDKNIQGDCFYRCSICNFCLDISCSQNIPLLLVEKPKSHHHPLIFYPRPLLTPCDACGLVNVLDPSYACFQCNYMVHQSCMDLPRVIKITRHQHRLFHTPYIQSTSSPCRICYKPADIKYGHYSCNHGDCSYVVHSKCATHENIWDGDELEWEPEEPENTEDIFPFKKVGSDLIDHFSHKHLLKLEKYDGIRDAEKQCQACILPINSRDFYNCIQCEFFLHEVCAGLLRKLDHALHKHPLVLLPYPETDYSLNGCLVCCRESSGFRYKCSKENCVLGNKAQIDVRCVLVPDYFTHKAHEHPIFISTSSKGENKTWCKGCKETCKGSYLQCTLCKFALCYQCVTIPTEVYYKHDKHPLSLCYGEVPEDMYWCEICEKQLDPRDWFYTCNKCCITIHRHCIFGSSVYMKPGLPLFYKGCTRQLKVLRNSKSTRPVCTQCGQRCPSSVYYSYRLYRLGSKSIFCSLNCFELLTRNTGNLSLNFFIFS